jgi:hypothetical protein
MIKEIIDTISILTEIIYLLYAIYYMIYKICSYSYIAITKMNDKEEIKYPSVPVNIDTLSTEEIIKMHKQRKGGKAKRRPDMNSFRRKVCEASLRGESKLYEHKDNIDDELYAEIDADPFFIIGDATEKIIKGCFKKRIVKIPTNYHKIRWDYSA